MELPTKVTINEVGLRDGLQLEKKIISTLEKVQLVDILTRANIRMLEFGSFVNPKAVPQMADSKLLFESIYHKGNIKLIGLVPNLKGLHMAHASGVKEVNYVFSISNTHNQQNVNKTTEESIEDFEKIKEYCESYKLKLNVTLATSFGCPFEGEIKQERVVHIADQLISNGLGTLTFADTTGMANPSQVYNLTKEVKKIWPHQSFGLHFHNTRGMGLANIISGLQGGITLFDTALGGLGGCPFAPGATGNVCTEDVVHMLEEMGIDTGIDLKHLLTASEKLMKLVEHELPSHIVKAGVSSRRYPVPTNEGVK